MSILEKQAKEIAGLFKKGKPEYAVMAWWQYDKALTEDELVQFKELIFMELIRGGK